MTSDAVTSESFSGKCSLCFLHDKFILLQQFCDVVSRSRRQAEAKKSNIYVNEAKITFRKHKT